MTANSPRRAEAARLELPRLYPIVDLDLCRLRGCPPEALAAALVEGGARFLQIRQKSPGSGPFLAVCRAIVTAVRAAGVAVIVNDRADLAVMADASGVHVGQDDLPPAAVRRIIGEHRLIGLSTHTAGQVDAALRADVDYVAVGPVFRTRTKDTGYEPRGLDLVRHAAGRGRPIVAIGGVTLANAGAVLAAGATSVAVISDLLSGGDPTQRVREFLAMEGR